MNHSSKSVCCHIIIRLHCSFS